MSKLSWSFLHDNVTPLSSDELTEDKLSKNYFPSNTKNKKKYRKNTEIMNHFTQIDKFALFMLRLKIFFLVIFAVFHKVL